MRGLVVAVVVMGVLIVAGIATIAVTIVRRLSGPAVMSAAAVLDEPPGTHMAALTAAGERLAVLLSGGGPDRVILIDPRTGQVTGRVGLAR
jgi:hypothetical protein